MKKLHWLGGVAFAALLTSPAFAQSTASQIEEIVVNAKRGGLTVSGMITAEESSKTRSTITEEFIAKQATGQSALQLVNLLPAVNFTNNDPYGSSGGNIRMRSFDGNRISLTFDGIPLNDSGNYAIFSNQLLDSDVISRINVSLGTTDIDSPTASATGGTINIVSKTPSDEFGVLLNGSIGSFAYRRASIMVDSGVITDFGTKAWLQGSWQTYDKFKGPGELKKKQINGRIYQPLSGNDFISIAGHFNSNRNNNYRNPTLAQWQTLGKSFEFFNTCTRLPGGPGAQNEGTGTLETQPGGCANWVGVQVNPSDTGNVRIQSRFTLTDSLALTIDPYYQYTIATGGGGSNTLAENDPRLIGGTTRTGVDLNGDGDTLDTIRVRASNVTRTNRPGVFTSLLWTINDDHRVRVGYTYERARHRQTGPAALLDIANVSTFGGHDGSRIKSATGQDIEIRNRFSIAELSQWSGAYTGQFFDKALTLSLGVRAPTFSRELNNYCTTVQRSPALTFFSGNVYCSTNPAQPLPPAAAGFSYGLIQLPFKRNVEYSKVLPVVGATYRFNDNHQIYTSFSQGLSAPRTDNLYAVIPVVVTPETTNAYDIGYRYQAGSVIGSIAGYLTKYKNRIQSSTDPVTNITTDRNLGDVDIKGFDAELGAELVPGLTGYVSTSYIESKVKSDILLPGNLRLPTGGKELSETPNWTLSGRLQYEWEDLTVSAQAKYVGERWSTDVNDEKSPSYTLVDLDLSYKLDKFIGKPGTLIQLNVINLFDKNYLGSISSRTNAIALPGSAASAPTYNIGAPRTIQGSLKVQF